MSLIIEQSYGLLFHLMEYWDRESKAARMAALLRLESPDINDPSTLVGLEHVETLGLGHSKNTSRGKNLKQVRYSFPPQPHIASVESLSFLTPEGFLQSLSIAKPDKNLSEEERLTNFDKGTICLQIPEDLGESSWFSEENVHTLTEYEEYLPGAKQDAFLGNKSKLMKAEDSIKEKSLEIKELGLQIENEDKGSEDAEEKIQELKEEIKKLEEDCEDFDEWKGFVEQFIDDPDSKKVTVSLLRRDLPSPAVPKDWGERGSVPKISELVEFAKSLDNSYLAIQGPPGTGKTYTGARIIHHLVTVEKKKVGITAQSHDAIVNLLEKVTEFAEEEGAGEGLNPHYHNPRKPIDGVTCGKFTPGKLGNDTPLLMASTTWFWAHADFNNKEHLFDYLVIDEAGQLSLADALAASKGAKNVILLGDPQQLPQVNQASHPSGSGFDSGASILGHLLGDVPTMPHDRGVFLDQTWRLDPAICTFISEEFYDGRLKSVESIDRKIEGRQNGLFWIPVSHDDEEPCVDENQQEAKKITEVIASLMDGSKFIEDGVGRTIEIDDFMIVAPFNRQRRKIRETLQHDLGIDFSTAESVVGTVDKFQGKEAPIVLYSLTTSSYDSIPRGREEFLFSPNRFNVAVSRAQCMAFLIGSETLIDTRAGSIPEMQALNHFCRYVDDPSLKSSQDF